MAAPCRVCKLEAPGSEVQLNAGAKQHLCFTCAGDLKVALNYLRYYIGFGSSSGTIPAPFQNLLQDQKWTCNSDLTLYRGLAFSDPTLVRELKVGAQVTLNQSRTSCWSRDLAVARSFAGDDKVGVVYSFKVQDKPDLVLLDTSHPKFPSQHNVRPKEQLVICIPGQFPVTVVELYIV